MYTLWVFMILVEMFEVLFTCLALSRKYKFISFQNATPMKVSKLKWVWKDDYENLCHIKFED